MDVARYFTEQVVRWGITYDEPEIPTAVGILQLITADPESSNAAKEQIDALIGTL